MGSTRRTARLSPSVIRYDDDRTPSPPALGKSRPRTAAWTRGITMEPAFAVDRITAILLRNTQRRSTRRRYASVIRFSSPDGEPAINCKRRTLRNGFNSSSRRVRASASVRPTRRLAELRLARQRDYPTTIPIQRVRATRSVDRRRRRRCSSGLQTRVP